MRRYLPLVLLVGLFVSFTLFQFLNPDVYAASYTWDGGGATNNWSECANWSTDICPIAGDAVTFNATSTKNSVVDAAWTASNGVVTNITIASGYDTGVLSLERSLRVNGTFSIADGTFTANAQWIDFNGPVTFSGGVFNASSGTMNMAHNFTHTSGGTFNHNNGTVVVDAASTWNVSTTEELFNLQINNTNASFGALTVSSGDTLNVNGVLTLTDGWIAGSNGTIAAKGAVSVGPLFGNATNANGILLINGSGAQAVTISPQTDVTFEIADQFTLNNASATVTGTGATGRIGFDKITVTAGTFNMDGYNMTAMEAVVVNGGTMNLGSGTNALLGTFTLSSGTFNGGSGSIDANGAMAISGGTYNATSGSLSLSANFTHTAGGTFNHQNGTFVIDGSSTWDVATSEELYNLHINNTNNSFGAHTVSTGDTLNVNGTLTLTDGWIAGSNGTIAAKGAVSVGPSFGRASNPNGTLLINGSSAQAVTIASPTDATFELVDQFTLNNASATVTGTGTSGRIGFDKVTVTAGLMNMDGYNMTANEAFIVNGGTLTLGDGTHTVSSTFVMSSGTTNGSSSTTRFSNTFTLSGGTFNASTGAMTYASTWVHTAGGTFNHLNGTSVFTGTSTTIDVASSETFGSIILNKNNGAALTIASGDSIVATGTLTLTEGRWLTGTLIAQGDVNVGADFDNTTTANFRFSGGNVQTLTMDTLTKFSFGDVYINKSGGQLNLGSTWTMNSTNNDLIVQEGTLDLNGYNLTVTGAGTETFIIEDGGNLQLQGGETITGDSASYPQLNSGSTVTYDGGSGPYTLKDYSYQSIEIAGGASSVFTLPGTLALAQKLTITSGILSLDGNDLTVTGTFSNEGTLRLHGDETVTLTNDSNSGTVEYVGNADEEADAYVLKDWPYYNLSLSFTDAADSATAAGAALDVNGTFSLSEGEFTAPATMNVFANFSHTGGAFNHNDGTVVLDGTNQTILGTTTFNHLTKSVSAAATLTFPASLTQTILGTLTLNGAEDERLSLRSSTDGVQAEIDPQGTRTVSYLDVEDNNNINATAVSCLDGCVGGDNVTNWTFTNAGITVGAISGNTTEAGGTATFTVVLDSVPSADVTIGLTSTDVTEGTVSPASLTFDQLDWDIPQLVTVTGADDFVIDGDVDYSIILAPAVSADPGYDELNPSDVAVTNEDNDTAGVIVTESATSTDVTEGGVTDTYTLVLTAQPTADVTITLTPDALITTDVPEAVFTALNWSTPQTVTVTAVDDDVASGPLTPSIAHTTHSADDDFDGLAVDDVVVNRTDDDLAGITVGTISGDTTEAGGTATFTVVLTSEPTADVTIGISSSDTTEGTVLPVTLTFTALNWDSLQTVTVTGVDDDVIDGSVSYSIVLAASVSVDPNYSGINPTDVDLNNADDDTAGVLVTASDGSTEVSEAGATDTYTLVLTAQPAADVTVSVSPEAPVETDVEEVVFTAENWNVPQEVTVSAVDDSIAQGTHVHAILHGTSSSDVLFDNLDVSDINTSVLDDDTAGITVSAISGNTTEAGGTATFTVVLTSEPTADVSIGVTTSDATEGTVSPSTLTFTALNWDTPQTVTVTGVDDDVDDGDVAYSVVLASAVSDDTVYNEMNPADVALENQDNDTAGITLVESDDDTTVTEGGATDAYTLVLNSEPTANVTIFFIGDGDVTTSETQIVFTSVNWSVPQAIIVTAVDDSVVEGTEMHAILHVVTSADVLYDDFPLDGVPVTVLDNDDEDEEDAGAGGGGGGGGGSSSQTDQFSLDIQFPQNGGTYAIGPLHVSWRWTGTVPSVNVYLSWDSGTTWALQRYFITNTGSTTITLDRESTAARIRVEGTDFIRALVTDETGVFSVSADVSSEANEVEGGDGQTDAAEIAAIAARVAALPSGFEIHGLVKLADDGNPETHHDSTVYYIGADGYRHAFPNSQVFGSWFCTASELISSLETLSAAQITEVTLSELSVVPLGPNITYRPGYKMVKFMTDPRVYAVDADGSLRWVLSETDAAAIYGEDWRLHIYDISDAFYRNYRFAAPLTDSAWDPKTVRQQVRYPSDVMKIPGYDIEPAQEIDLCLTM